ncbi:MAG: carboxypeptidase-like regulatory domain-containing protein, partial [Bacteroidota bacterium]
VLDEAGNPVSNAKISVARTSFTTTNRDGSFRIKTSSKLTQINPSDVRILQAPRFMIKRTNFNQRSNFLTVIMQPATELRGQLLVRDDSPIAGHQIVLLGVNDFTPARANSQGKFVIQYPNNFKLDKEAVFKVDDQIISPNNVRFENNGGLVKITFVKNNALTTAPVEETAPQEEISATNQKRDRILLINAQGQPLPNHGIKLNSQRISSDTRGYIYPNKLDFNKLPTIDVSPADLLQKLSDPPLRLLRLVIKTQSLPNEDDAYSLEEGFNEITKGLKDDRQAQIDRSNQIQNQMSELTSRLLQESHFTPAQRNVIKNYLHTLRETLVDNDSIYNDIKEEFQNRLFKMESLVVEKDSLRSLAEARAEKISIEKQRVEDEKKLAEVRFRDNLIILSIIILVLLALASTFYFYNRDIKRKNNELEITKNEL